MEYVCVPLGLRFQKIFLNVGIKNKNEKKKSIDVPMGILPI